MNQRLFLVMGLQGSGKTEVAGKIAEKFDAVLLRSDVLRKELFKKSHYTKEESKRVYEEMFHRAQTALKNGKSVVLDATFKKEEERKFAKIMANEFWVKYEIINVVCDEKILEKRINERTGDASEATFEIYLKSKSGFEPVEGEHLVFDNSGPMGNINKFVNSLI